MGEIADMMLDGTLCMTCGEYLDDGGPSGFPRSCAGCADDDAGDAQRGYAGNRLGLDKAELDRRSVEIAERKREARRARNRRRRQRRKERRAESDAALGSATECSCSQRTELVFTGSVLPLHEPGCPAAGVGDE